MIHKSLIFFLFVFLSAIQSFSQQEFKMKSIFWWAAKGSKLP